MSRAEAQSRRVHGSLGDLKVGSKVIIHYTMTAHDVEVKDDKKK